MSGDGTPLALTDGVELGHAWLAAFCERRGVRVLFIKGPSLSHHLLRRARTSSDVDALIDPARFDLLCEELTARGWVERDSTFATERYIDHSRTFVWQGWPCDLDVHSHFPGFLRPATVVFEALWARRETLDFAHFTCAIPDRLTSILILGLHSKRSIGSNTRHADELNEMLSTTVLSPAERVLLHDLAVETGADQTMADALLRLGITVDIRNSTSPPLVEWNARVNSGASPAYMWLNLLTGTRGVERLRVARHALWPKAEDLSIMYPGIAQTRASRVAARVRRLLRGAVETPRALRAVIRARRGRRTPPPT